MRIKFASLLMIGVALLLITGCGSGKGSTNAEPAAIQSIQLLEYGKGNDVVPYTGDAMSLEVAETPTGFRATINLNSEEKIKAQAFMLGYDPARLVFEDSSAGQYFAQDGDPFYFSYGEQPGLFVGMSALPDGSLDRVSGQGTLGYVDLAVTEEGKSTADGPGDRVGPPPDLTGIAWGEDFTSTLVVSIDEKHPADVNKDAFANGRDVFSLALHFNEDATELSCLDLYDDDVINGLDLFQIAYNFNMGTTGYQVMVAEWRTTSKRMTSFHAPSRPRRTM